MVATVPTLVESAIPAGTTVFSGFGATSLLILVGVAIDTAKQIQTYVISQRYEGNGQATVIELLTAGLDLISGLLRKRQFSHWL